jgi:hypothetical protein
MKNLIQSCSHSKWDPYLNALANIVYVATEFSYKEWSLELDALPY